MVNKTDAIAVSGTIGQALSVLALPTLLAQMVQSAGSLGEAYFVGKIGDAAMAAIGAVWQVSWLLMILTMMVSVGATTLIAQRWGARDTDGARAVVITAVQQSLFLGIAAIALWFSKDLIWHWLGIKPAITKLATTYLAAVAISFPLVSIGMSIMASYRGMGDMVTPLIVTLIGVSIQLTLNAILIPIWKMEGAATALIVSYLAASIFILWKFSHSALKFPLSQLFNWQPNLHRALLGLGVPAAFQALQWSLAYMAYFAILARTPNSTEALASLTAGGRIETLAFMPGLAFGIAAQTLVGQNIGAKQSERAKKGGWQAAFWCALVMGLISVVFLTAADWLAARFTQDPTTHRYIASYLRINALCQPFLALSMTLGGALRGAGDTISPALITAFSMWVLRLPATYWLCVVLGNDAVAAWWTMSLSTIVSGILMALIFARTRKFTAEI